MRRMNIMVDERGYPAEAPAELEAGVLNDAPDDSPYLPASDGLPARKSGEWAKRKHHYLRNYCGITTKSMRNKWRLVYLDVMAGPGLCKEDKSGDEFPGSPFVALEFDFSQYLFIEGDAALYAALEKRLEGH